MTYFSSHRLMGCASFLALVLFSAPTFAEDFTVKKTVMTDPKVVFATIESTDVVAARARIGGTIINLDIKEGDEVKAGQVIAVIGDQKLALQTKTLDAQVKALAAQADRADADYKRMQNLVDSDAISKSSLDTAKAAALTAQNQLKATRAQREVIAQTVTEGKIIAPSNGRILHVPLLSGSVVMAGESIATIAADDYVLRLNIPERHAAYLKAGDKITLENKNQGEGTITLVYPAIENGRVIADVKVENLENYFVGERVRVWVNTAERHGFTIPQSYITTKSGVDYVHLVRDDGKNYAVPVQVGQKIKDTESVEILSGLRDGDIITNIAGE